MPLSVGECLGLYEILPPSARETWANCIAPMIRGYGDVAIWLDRRDADE
jgi:hypothetical protein